MYRWLAVPLAPLLLVLAGGLPGAAVEALRSPGPDPTATVVALAVLLAWAALGWLLLLVLLTLSGQLTGPVGRAGRALLQVAAPVAVRRAVALSLGLGVVLGGQAAASAAPAPAASASAPASAAAPDLDWPGLAAAPAPTPPPAPTPTQPPPTQPPPTQAPPGAVVVRPGDTLWTLAASRLPPTATTREVAAAWPAWWSANRTVIGPDPDLLRPGQSLQPPTAAGRP
jgi:hypothetical protein